MEFSGRLATIQFGDVLQLAHQERWTGALVVRRSSREKRIFLDAGKVVGCLSDDPGEYYGRHLLLRGILDEKAIARALAWCNDHGGRLGEALVKLELLSEEEVRGSLASRISDAVCDLFLWDRGVFYLENDRMPEVEIPPRALDVFGLVMEGTRWIDEVARMRRVLISDNLVLGRGPRWPPPADLPMLDRWVTRAVDGERDLSELHRLIGGVQFHFLEAVYRLCLAEVLDIQEVGDESVTATAEVSLLDILMEQATREESALLGERHFSIPVDLLVELVPAWTGSGGAAGARAAVPFGGGEAGGGDLSAADHRFLAAIDGRQRIRDILSTATDARSRQFELLLVHLRRGGLALLPGPAAELQLQG